MKNIHVIIIGLAAIIAASSPTIIHHYAGRNTADISTVGAATKRFESDIVKWKVTVGREVGADELASGCRMISADIDSVARVLRQAGIADSAIAILPANSRHKQDRHTQTVIGYAISQSLYVVSTKVAEIEAIALAADRLTEMGLILQGSSLEYFYSGLPEVKTLLLKEAAENARRRAEMLAGGQGIEVGPATSIRAGVFQISEPYSTDYRPGGRYNTQSRMKDITVTAHVNFRQK